MINRLFVIVGLTVCVLLVLGQEIATERVTLGKLKDSRLNELSGLIKSSKQSDMFWTHNDSGDSARIFLIDAKAQLKGIYYLEGTHLVDAEDIATFQKDGKSYLLVADIGDNQGKRKDIQLYVFEEPDWTSDQFIYHIPKKNIKRINMQYEDKARDAEAIFVDPLDLKAYLISKRDFQVGIYPIDLSADTKDRHFVLKPSLHLPLTFITAADISRDGSTILIKNLAQVFLWRRNAGKSIAETLGAKPETVVYTPEPQGEAICFDEKNTFFYTVSERPLGLDAYLYRYHIQSKL
ncbi:hypothetical protein [Sphingobacterium sp. LRF_L2]|uniref:hypothetical protein n=1 Tax=Sphingobacterium sp. LRF_L2 TaxID=3369421 RepID=UPI003F624054